MRGRGGRARRRRREGAVHMARGVSASKEDVHAAIADVDKGLFPKAFCKVVPDLLTGGEDFCTCMHADGAGTKSSLAYMYWKETGDLSVWRGIAQDAVIMNTDDLLAIGCVDNILLSSTIGRNKSLIEVLKALIGGTEDVLLDDAGERRGHHQHGRRDRGRGRSGAHGHRGLHRDRAHAKRAT